MEAERQRYLEVLVSSSDSTELIEARALARWLGNVIDEHGLRQDMKATREHQLTSKTEDNDEGDLYMEPDSEQTADTTLENR